MEGVVVGDAVRLGLGLRLKLELGLVVGVAVALGEARPAAPTRWCKTASAGGEAD